MEDHVDMEEDFTSNVPMLEARGTFVAGTADGTVHKVGIARSANVLL